jgi:hypothetical protein
LLHRISKRRLRTGGLPWPTKSKRERQKKDGFRSALVGGVVGAMATAVVGILIVFLTNIGNAITDWTAFQITKSVIAHSKVYLREGD